MKESLDRFLRSLAERELEGAAPETLQDLGTFVDWLVDRLGFTVHLRAFKYAGLEREKSAGRLQLGVDMLATRRDAEGALKLYRFVLKASGVTKADWGRSGEPGNIVHDVRLAADRSLDRDHQDFAIGSDIPSAVVIVAVHNGDFDGEALGGSRLQLKEELSKRGIELEWWDAGELVRLAEPLIAKGPDGEEGGDAGLFPPAVRPFARLAIDSVRRDPRSFDFRAVDDYLEARLPLNRKLRRDGGKEILDAGLPIKPLILARRAAEVPVFNAMLVAEFRVSGEGLTLPCLDTLERSICRVTELAQRNADSSASGHSNATTATLRLLLRQYVEVAHTLRARLDTLRQMPYGLAVVSLSETMDYPLRCHRLLGYMATAGLASLDLGDVDDARAFAETISATWTNNDAACESPVTDDQVIELAAIWSLLLRLDLRARVGQMATSLVHGLLARRRVGLPLPALWQRANTPMADQDLRIIATAYAFGPNASPEFIHDSSTLLSVASYLGFKHGSLNPANVNSLREGEQDTHGRDVVPRCSFQLWLPPLDAALEWYAHEIAHRGTAYQFMKPQNREPFLTEFEAQAPRLGQSHAQRIGLPAIDVIAWKRWRTLPDMRIIIDAAS